MRLMGIGAEFATVLYLEGLFRRFENRQQLAAYAGLAPSPWIGSSPRSFVLGMNLVPSLREFAGCLLE